MSCGRITRGSVPICDELPEAGTRARLVLINWDDIRFIFESNGIITSIELYPEKQAYEFFGFRADVKKSEDVVKPQTLKSRFRHATSFIIYENDQRQKTNIKCLVRGRFLAITENKGKDENSLEVLGKECGLAIVGGLIRDAHENGGMFLINLATPDNGVEMERKLPQNLGVTYEEGLAIIAGMINEHTFDMTTITFDSTIFTFDLT